MRLLIDGDAASQIETAVIFARKNNIMVHIYCDYNHEYESEYAQIHIVDQSPGSADYAIISFLQKRGYLDHKRYRSSIHCAGQGSICVKQQWIYLH